jgi:hypothetical protein
MTDVVRSRPAMTALWASVIVGPPAWAVHIVLGGAMVHRACESRSWWWGLHGLTLATALPTAAGLAYCIAVARREPDPEDAPTPFGRTRFIAIGGALIAAISLMLIFLEGSYVLFIDACG